MTTNVLRTLRMGKLLATLVFSLLFCHAVLLPTARAQDQDQDDPPGRVARLGYMQGAVSFQPAGESDWVEAVRNRPLTIEDKLWADQDSRAEVELGSAVIHLASNTGFSFLNLDDQTVQIDLSSGVIDVSVRRLGRVKSSKLIRPTRLSPLFNQASIVSRPPRTETTR
jgi:hypothetical protein